MIRARIQPTAEGESHPIANGIIRHWRWLLVVWLAIAVAARVISPSWEEVAYDGDFDYLPADQPSVVGGRLLDAAFPDERSRSEIVIVIARDEGPLHERDESVALDLHRRLMYRLAVSRLARARQLGWSGGVPQDGTHIAQLIVDARQALDTSIQADERFYEQFFDCLPDTPPTLTEPRMACAYWKRAELLDALGHPDEAASDRQAALNLVPDISQRMAAAPVVSDIAVWEPLIDVLSWDDPVIGHRLRRKGARLLLLRLDTELAATSNIATLQSLKQLVATVETYSGACTEPGLNVLTTGSAAVGGEILTAARDAIRYTEIFTVLIILLILTVVYRSPLLIVVPLLSIGVAVVAATGMVATLAMWSRQLDGEWLDLRVFTTSKIFVVVILFGAGTDYCLFLIARLREEAAKRPWPDACRIALSRVTGALLGSALTTVVGLGMLWIADFGKFHYTGPVIGLCLLVGLAVCTTLTPALLYAIGPRVFWPHKVEQTDGRGSPLWGRIALLVTAWPFVTLSLGFALLIVPAVYGAQQERSVTYDLSSQLSPDALSRRGLEVLADHFPMGEISPTTLLLVRPEPVDRETMSDDIRQLREGLYELPGVAAVRTAGDPLGDFPPDKNASDKKKKMGLLDRDAWRRRILQQHRVAQRYFYSDAAQFAGRLARLDLIINGDPFDIETAEQISTVRRWLEQEIRKPDSPWQGAQLAVAGTTASIIDLRSVTLQDNRRIKVAVVIAVLIILVMVLRRIWLSIYLILTVLLSYYATLGLTVWLFRYLYGETYVGLDWKLPLFLFVILVAVGQDYNVYLVTRVLEEQQRGGWLSALRRAVARTGGIITSCGVVMAGTFFCMTASGWVPGLMQTLGFAPSSDTASLRGIVELGFALGLGVLIDTFYVRTILVPAFITVVDRVRARYRAKFESWRNSPRVSTANH